MCRRMRMCRIIGWTSLLLRICSFIERARYKIDALNAKRVDALQYVNGESLSILGIPVTLRLVEQDGKPHIGFDGKAILTYGCTSWYDL